jgi:hypothetical protein
MDFNKPINKNCSHLLIYVCLLLKITHWRDKVLLCIHHVLKHIFCKFCNVLRIRNVLSIKLMNFSLDQLWNCWRPKSAYNWLLWWWVRIANLHRLIMIIRWWHEISCIVVVIRNHNLLHLSFGCLWHILFHLVLISYDFFRSLCSCALHLNLS